MYLQTIKIRAWNLGSSTVLTSTKWAKLIEIRNSSGWGGRQKLYDLFIRRNLKRQKKIEMTFFEFRDFIIAQWIGSTTFRNSKKILCRKFTSLVNPKSWKISNLVSVSTTWREGTTIGHVTKINCTANLNKRWLITRRHLLSMIHRCQHLMNLNLLMPVVGNSAKFKKLQILAHFVEAFMKSWGVAALNLPVGLTKGSPGGFVPSNLGA